MINLGMIIRVGHTFIHTSNGHSGPWTESDTKILITMMIVSVLLFIVSVVIEKIRGLSFKEIVTLNIDGDDLSIFSACSIIACYSTWLVGLLLWLGSIIYNLI
jgi:hypothetical protein